MKIVYKGQTLAESDSTLLIEGNQYFPPESINSDFFADSDLHTTCVWKGEASYYDISVDEEVLEAAAWYYPQPKEGSPERVGSENGKDGAFDFSNYVAFYLRNGVELVE